jgi:hypothetical protein
MYLEAAIFPFRNYQHDWKNSATWLSHCCYAVQVETVAARLHIIFNLRALHVKTAEAGSRCRRESAVDFLPQ